MKAKDINGREEENKQLKQQKAKKKKYQKEKKKFQVKVQSTLYLPTHLRLLTTWHEYLLNKIVQNKRNTSYRSSSPKN